MRGLLQEVFKIFGRDMPGVVVFPGVDFQNQVALCLVEVCKRTITIPEFEVPAIVCRRLEGFHSQAHGSSGVGIS